MKAKTAKRELDMLHGSIWNKIPLFALPVAATAILEQLFNASDIAIVGNFTGAQRTAAVAAVGANSPIISLLVNLFVGIALGANVVIAHAIGQGDKNTVKKAVHTSILVSLLGGVLVAALGELAAAPLLRLLQMLDESGVKCTLKLCTRKYRLLKERGRTDILRLLGNHELAFHTTDHSIHPLPTEYLDRMGFKEGAEAFDRHE